MPVLQTIRKQFIKTQPLADLNRRLLACDDRTANLMVTLRDGGANACCAHQSAVHTGRRGRRAGAGLRYSGFRHQGRNNDVYYLHLSATPIITADHHGRWGRPRTRCTKRQDLLEGIVGGTEETTTGVIRLRAMAKEGVLRYPIIAVNDAYHASVRQPLLAQGRARSTA